MTALDLIAQAHADLKAVQRISTLSPDWNATASKIRIQAKLLSAAHLIAHQEEESDANPQEELFTKPNQKGETPPCPDEGTTTKSQAAH